MESNHHCTIQEAHISQDKSPYDNLFYELGFDIPIEGILLAPTHGA